MPAATRVDAAPSELTRVPGRPAGRFASRAAFAAVALLCAAVASGLVFHDLSVGHNLYGLDEYDDGVYFGAAVHLVAGQLPYRDFVFVQPPGISILLSPIALVTGGDTRFGMAIARVVTGSVVGIDAALICFILRRKGLLAALFGGLAFAIFPPGYTANRTVMLEPYLVGLCLVSIALCFSKGALASRRRLVWAGIVLGLAATVKLVAAALAIGLFFALVVRHRRALAVVGSAAAATFVVVCLPFFLGAPHGFISQIFGSQFFRTTGAPAPVELRLATLTGLAYATSRSALPIGPGEPWPWVAAWSLIGVITAGTAYQVWRRRADTETWCVLWSALAAVVLLLYPRQYYDHYAQLPMTFCVLVIGGVVGSVSKTFPLRRHPTGRWLSATAGAVLACVLLIGSAIVLRAEIAYQEPKLARLPDPGPGLEQAIPKGACVVSDAQSLLVSANRVDVSPGCPPMVDSTGTWLAVDPNHPPQRNRKEPMDPALVRTWRQVFSHAQYAVFAGNNAFRVPFTPSLVQWFNDRFQVVPGAAPITFVRRARPVRDAPAVPGAVP